MENKEAEQKSRGRHVFLQQLIFLSINIGDLAEIQILLITLMMLDPFLSKISASRY